MPSQQYATGIEDQSKRFPMRFIIELLNKRGSRIILTGKIFITSLNIIFHELVSVCNVTIQGFHWVACWPVLSQLTSGAVPTSQQTSCRRVWSALRLASHTFLFRECCRQPGSSLS